MHNCKLTGYCVLHNCKLTGCCLLYNCKLTGCCVLYSCKLTKCCVLRQEGTVVESVHIVGASLTFIGGLFYCFLQTAMSYHMCPDYNGLFVCRVRLAVCLVSLSCLLASILIRGGRMEQGREGRVVGIGGGRRGWGMTAPDYHRLQGFAGSV